MRGGPSTWRWAAAICAAMVLVLGFAPALAADSSLSLTIAQNPATPAARGGSNFATFDLVLTNNGPNTVNNIVLYVNTGENAAATSANPACVLAPASSATCTVNPSNVTLPTQTAPHPGFIFSVTQLSKRGTAKATVSFYTPNSGPLSVYAFAVGASTASTTTPSAQTGVKAVPYPLATALAELPATPSVKVEVIQAAGNVFRTVPHCDLAQVPPVVDGCGYVNYIVRLTSLQAAPIAGPIYIDVSGAGTLTGTTKVQFSDVLLCVQPSCMQATAPAGVDARFAIAHLAGFASNEFVVQFTTPSVAGLTATAHVVFSPDISGPTGSKVTTDFRSVYDLQPGEPVPISTRYGGAVKRKTDPSSQFGYGTVIRIPKDEAGDYPRGLQASVDQFAQNDSCSPAFKVCLGSDLQIFTNPADAAKWQGLTLDDPGNRFLNVELTRDYTTFSSSGNALHANVYYVGDNGLRVAVPKCDSVNTSDPTVLRCISKIFSSLQKDKKNNYVSGVVTFYIYARENGRYSW
jgi:hypothetical protein